MLLDFLIFHCSTYKDTEFEFRALDTAQPLKSCSCSVLTHEITNLISQAQDESLFVRRLETGADLLFHFLARLNCKGYKGVFSVNLAMVVRLNLFTGHFAARKICKKVTSLTGGPN